MNGDTASPPQPFQILFIDDEPALRRTLQRWLSRLERVELLTVATHEQAVWALESRKFDLVISDFELQNALGTSVLSCACRLQPAAERWLTSSQLADEIGVGSLFAVADRFVPKACLVAATLAWLEADGG